MRRLITTILGVVIFISACTSRTNQIATLPSSTPKPSITVEDTQKHIRPTQTPTFVEPTIVPTPRLNHLDIPKWASDPNVDVLLLPIGESLQFGNFALINSVSGEIYELPDLKHGGYFWMSDGKHFGVLSQSKNEITLIDIVTGDVSYHTPSERAVQFVNVDNESTYSYKAIGNSVEDPKFMLIYSWWIISSDSHYIILEDPYDERYTRVLNLQTNETITVTDKDDNIFDLGTAWSPTGAYLGIVHSDAEPGLGFSFEKEPNFRLKVYDIELGNTISVYENIPSVDWSPDGTKLLYQPWKWLPSDGLSNLRNPPCVFDTITGITKCYNETVIRHTTTATYLLELGPMGWSPDGKIIGYIYFRAENKSQEPYYEEQGGMCLITIDDNSVKCMLEKFEGDDQRMKPSDFWWSPNGNYLAVTINDTSPYSDDVSGSKFGILDINNGRYFIIEKQDPSRFESCSWRPKINP
jgi:hypothetical protein